MKRGIIRLLNVEIDLDRKDFSYDVHSLVKAFYPGEEVRLLTQEDAEPPAGGEQGLTGTRRGRPAETAAEDAAACPLRITIRFAAEDIALRIERKEQRLFEETTALSSCADRTQEKNELKRLLYRGLSRVTKVSLPWGTLTGIRPVKLPMKQLEEGKTAEQAAAFLRETYYVSEKKTQLCVETAQRERRLLGKLDYREGYSLYVGIPFCPSICLYCSFSSSPIARWENQVDAYLDALCRELAFVGECQRGKKLQTVYIGGGTPTTLTPGQIDRLLAQIGSCFDLSSLVEFTFEAGRADSITREKLAVLKDYPINRICINPQTMNQKTLDLIGRRCTAVQTKEAFALARSMGFDNINMDIIVGLPGEGQEEVAYTLEEIRRMDPDDLTVHSLARKRASRLVSEWDEYSDLSFENTDAIMELTHSAADSMGMTPYYLYRQKNMAGNFENVGYAKLDKAGIYNILIMEEKQSIFAVGAGASTKFVYDDGARIERVENVKDVKNYLERIDEMIARKDKMMAEG